MWKGILFYSLGFNVGGISTYWNHNINFCYLLQYAKYFLFCFSVLGDVLIVLGGFSDFTNGNFEIVEEGDIHIFNLWNWLSTN